MQQLDLTHTLLTDDALLHIFSWLKPIELARSTSTCRRWRCLAKSNCLWRPNINRDLPHFPLAKRMTPFDHYCINGRGIRLKKLHIANELIFSAWGKTLCIWEKQAGFPIQYSCYRTQTDHTAAIESFAVRQIGLLSLVITGSADNAIKVWRKKTQSKTYTLLQTLTNHKSPVISIQGIHDFLFCGSTDGELSVWKYSISFKGFKPAQSPIKAHRCGLRMLLAAPHLRCLFTVGENNQIKVWNLGIHKLRRKQTLNLSIPRITAIAYDHLTDQVFCSSFEGRFYEFEKDVHNHFTLKSIAIVSNANLLDITVCQKIKKVITLENGNIIRIWSKKDETMQNLTQEKEIHLTGSNQATGIFTIPNGNQISKIYYIQNNELKMLDFYPFNRQPRCKQFTITAAEFHETRPIETKFEIVPITEESAG
jgi:WD40 repeat protein